MRGYPAAPSGPIPPPGAQHGAEQHSMGAQQRGPPGAGPPPPQGPFGGAPPQQQWQQQPSPNKRKNKKASEGRTARVEAKQMAALDRKIEAENARGIRVREPVGQEKFEVDK